MTDAAIKSEWLHLTHTPDLKTTQTLFRRLLWSVAIPEFIIMFLVGSVSYLELKDVLVSQNRESNEVLRSEIMSLMDFQDFSLSSIERDLDKRLELASWELRELYFIDSDSIERADLKTLAHHLKLDTTREFISIIARDGKIVNSSMPGNLGYHAFDFGQEFRAFLEDVFQSPSFHPVGFVLYPADKKLHKWSYQSTRDGRYIIQLGVSSPEGSRVSEAMRNIISRLSEKQEEVLGIDVYFDPDNVISFISSQDIDTEQKDLIKGIFSMKKDTSILSEEGERSIQTEYIYSERPGSNLYESLVVRLRKDKTMESDLLTSNLSKKFLLFALGLLVLFVILLFNTNLITKPIRLVASAAHSVGVGHLSKRVPVTGTRELLYLGTSFNKMAADLEESYRRIKEQKEKIERAHEEIQDSITYAKRIQAAILPPERLVKEYFNQSFILYKPKDIVAGDFYWMDRRDDTLFFACADCTGHGVPGAMVSVLCHSALNRSVREFGLRDAGAILTRTRDIVIEEFEKSEDEVLDGMDVALCALRGRHLEFSGAQRPLWILRGGEILETKGDKQPIGRYDELVPFSTHQVELQEGDTLYLFSDGMIDQFGGEKGKKLMSWRFKDILMAISDKDMQEQKSEIDREFEKWRGREMQVDDVCVIGVRV